jgi:ribosomal protein S12 methylthiotransferase accessory factor
VAYVDGATQGGCSATSHGSPGNQAAVLQLSGLLLDGDRADAEGVATPSGRRTFVADELRQQLTPKLGAFGITRVAHLTGLDHLGVPVHMAVKPQGRTLSSGSGKGVTKDASWVSAVMEAIEQTVWEGIEVSGVEASERALRERGNAFVPGDELQRRRGALWSDHLPIRWRAGWDILHGEEVWIPDSVVCFRDGGLSPFPASSNGLASGATVLEAVLSGLQEVIERDGIALHSLTTHGPFVDGCDYLDEVDPWLSSLVKRAKLVMELIDATTEIGVPTFVCYFRDAPGERLGRFKGAGAGTTTATALVRAVTEAAQGRTLVVAGARDDVFASMRRASIEFRAPLNQPIGSVTRSEPPSDAGCGSVIGDLSWLAGRLESCGFNRIVVVRHTGPSDPVQVVRVVVPRLEGYPLAVASPGRRALEWQREQRHTTSVTR